MVFAEVQCLVYGLVYIEVLICVEVVEESDVGFCIREYLIVFVKIM